MKRLFGTDGIRGEAGIFPLDETTIRTIGRSLAGRLKAPQETPTTHVPRIVIGRDTRESGAWIERAFAEGAREAGAVIESAGVITTPGVAYLARKLLADAGVVISASHNPYQDNGIKIFAPSGRKLDDATERLIEADIVADQSRISIEGPLTEAPDDSAQAARAAELREQYLKYLESEVGERGMLDGRTLVVDCANGAASELAPTLLERLGANVISINNNPDGLNINRDCGSLHIGGLQEKVRTLKADIGIAFDGDADRALFVDADGRFVDGDATLLVMARYFKEHGLLNGDAVVATVMSNIGLELALQSEGLHLVRTDVGDKYVLEELLRSGASLGGEQSGHIIFPRISLAGDGLITTLFVLRAMRESMATLDELGKEFVRYPQVLVNVRVREKLPFEEVEPIARAARDIEERLGPKGRLLLRYSGTEPLARVMIEGEEQDLIERYANELASIIKAEIG
jgi:phosphoglucosamine mutase